MSESTNMTGLRQVVFHGNTTQAVEALLLIKSKRLAYGLPLEERFVVSSADSLDTIEVTFNYDGVPNRDVRERWLIRSVEFRGTSIVTVNGARVPGDTSASITVGLYLIDQNQTELVFRYTPIVERCLLTIIESLQPGQDQMAKTIAQPGDIPTETDAPTDDAPSGDAGKEVRAGAPKRKNSGRPPLVLYDWAWKEIYTKKRDREEVYVEFVGRYAKETGKDYETEQTDPRGSFSEAMSYRNQKNR